MTLIAPAPEKLGASQPFPGLRPYDRAEEDIFFGRGEQIDQMLTSLEETRFLAVVGSSGCGKSSLVRAGLLPAIEEGFLTGKDAEWRFVITRPGTAPFRRLAEAIHAAAPGEDSGPEAAAFTEATLRSGPKGFLDALADAGFSDDCRLLLLVDQFEELFRLSDRSDDEIRMQGGEPSEVHDDAVAFVNLLLATAHQEDRPIPVVLTMRSDWIGRCDAFYGLPEAVSESQFLTPRMTRRQLQEAIEGPLKVFDAGITPELVTRILNEIGNQLDQLPLLQHALMRTWFAARSRWTNEENAPQILTREDYDRVGGFSRALFMHLEEAWDELEEVHEQRIARHLFLLMRKAADRGAMTRRMTTAGEVAAVADSDLETVARLVEVFRRDHRNFIVGPPAGAFKADSDLDISHEALLRQWDRLGRWAKVEEESEECFMDLAKVAHRWEKGEAGLRHPPELDLSLKWRESAQPTPAWAQRYGGDFDLVMRYLDTSREAHEASVRDQEAQAKRRRRNRLLVFAGIIPLVVLSVFAAAIYGQWREAETARDTAEHMAQEAERQRDRADARALALNAIEAGKDDEELAVLLALEATLSLIPADGSPSNQPVRVPPEIETSLRLSVAGSHVRQRFTGHTSGNPERPTRIFSLDIHPTAEHAITGGDWRDGTARIWNYRTGRELAVLDHGKTSISHVKFSPDGGQVLCATWREGGHAYVWDTPSELLIEEPAANPAAAGVPVTKTIDENVKHFQKHPDYVTSAAWHATRPLVATGCRYVERAGDPLPETPHTEDCLLLWDPNTTDVVLNLGSGRLPHDERLGGHAFSGRISSLAFSPDGNRFLSTTWETWEEHGEEKKSGRIVVWDLDALERAETHPRPVAENLDSIPLPVEPVDGPEPAMTVENEPDLVASDEPGGGEDIPTHDPGIAWEIAQAHGTNWIYAGAFSPDGSLIATVGADTNLRVWDAQTGRALASQAHGDIAMAVTFADNEHIVTGSNDTVVRTWKIEWIRETDEGTLRNRAREKDSNLVVHPAGVFRGHKKWMRAILPTPDGRFVISVNDDNSAMVWKRPPGGEVSAVADPDSTYTCGDVYLHKGIPGEEPDIVRAYCGTSEGEVHAYDAMTGQRVREGDFAGGHEPGMKVRSIAVSPDGTRLVTTSNDQTAVVWDIATGRPAYAPLLGHKDVYDDESNLTSQGGVVYSARFDPAGERIVTASNDGTVRVWKARDGSPVLFGGAPWIMALVDEEGRKAGQFYDARFSNDGKRIVAATFDKNSAWICDAGTGDILLKIEGHLKQPGGHRDTVTSAAFNPDGTTVVTASMDGTCKVWKIADPWGSNSNQSEHRMPPKLLEKPELLHVLPQGAARRSAEYSPDGSALLTSAIDGVSRIYHHPGYTMRSELRGHSEDSTVAHYSWDGKFIVTSGYSGEVFIHYSDPWAVYSLANSRVTRKLTASEWDEYDVKRKLMDDEKKWYQEREMEIPGTK